MLKIGYIRVSTVEQNEARQVEALKDCDKIFVEKLSGKDTNRPELQKMLVYIREGDILAVESLSRLARSTKDLLDIVEKVTSKGVNIISIKEKFDTSTPQGKFCLTIFAAMAELEREQILQRQREGIALAKAEGKYKGRQRIAVDDKSFTKVYKLWKAGELTAVQAMKMLVLQPNTFYRRVKEYETKKGIKSND